MDILSEGDGVETFGVDTPMTELISIPEKPTVSFPEGSVRNRAATSAMLNGDPNKIVDNYQLMMSEASEGSSVTHDQILQASAEQNRTGAMAGVIKILGDKTISLEEKQRVMNFVRKGDFKEDPQISLQAKALAVPSKGEDIRGEGARITTAEALGEMHDERVRTQKMVNAMAASLPEATGRTVGEFIETDILPFGRNIMAGKVNNNFKKKNDVPTSLFDWVKSYVLPGSSKAEIQKKLGSIPPEYRDKYTQSLLDSIKESATIFPDENYYAQYQNAAQLLQSPHSTTAEWVENAAVLLDAFAVGDIAKGLKGAGKATIDAAAGPTGFGNARRPGSNNPGVSDAENVVESAKWELHEDPIRRAPPSHQLPSNTKRIKGPSDDQVMQRLELNSVVRRENPVAPYNVIEQVNPAQAKAMHDVIQEGGDEVAKAFTGVTREQALANNIYPQVAIDEGSVLNKAKVAFDDVVTNTGALRYTTEELDSAVGTITRDFRGASGLEINDAMTTVKVDGDHILIDAHYSTPGGSFTTPEGAKAQAEYALRKYGVAPEDIVVMERSGMNYVPATGDQPGDYIIKVKTRQPIRDDDVTEWSSLDVKRNWLDSFSATGSEHKGSATGMLFDPGSVLHPTLTGSAITATDQAVTLEKILLGPIRELRDTIGGFSKERRLAIEDYMREANLKGMKLDPVYLSNRGFDDAEIESLKKWRDIWDGHYYLENYDAVRTLNAQGYQVLDNGVDKWFAKPVAKNQNIGKAYDPAQGKVVVLDKATMDSLYEQGGTYASLRRSVNMGGDEIEHIIVRNTPREYLRRVRDTDTVLNYREGYFTVNYKAAKFIDEITVDAAGKETRKTVAVAGNTADAQMFINSRQASTGVRHEMREDSKGFRKDSDAYWDLNEVSGRIAQRMRGKPLYDAQGINQLGQGAFVESPMESAVRAARSLAGRTISRPMLETAKRRFIQQYGDLLKPVQFGEKGFPVSRDAIVDHVDRTSKRVADARTTYQYIRYLEDGYINSADEFVKGVFNKMANEFGERGMSTAERALRKASENSPTQMLKGTVFRSYIAMSNPIRQWIVQGHQATRTIAYNPTGWATGSVPNLAARYLGGYTGIPLDAASRAFTKFVDDTGLIAGVDKNSLVRGMQMDMVDASFGAKRLAKQAWDVPQKVGFDPGEQTNQLLHLAAVYDKYMRKGMNLTDKTIRDQAASEARALSWDLNSAGELSYTQGSLATVLQFLQMPHKALLQATNRRLPLDVRMRMVGWDLLMWGGFSGGAGALVSKLLLGEGEDGGELLPENEDLRAIYVDGLEAWGINNMLTTMDPSGEKTNLDLTALSAYDMDGWARMFSAMLDKGALGTIASSPSGQLLAVDGVNGSVRNGRIPQAMLTMGRYFSVFDEVDPQNPTELDDVFRDVAKITSLWSAASNAQLMLESRKKYDAMGRNVDEQLTTPEIAGAFLGFGTKATKDLYEITQNRIKDKQKHEEDVMRRYRDIVRYYTTELESDNRNPAHIQKVTSMLMRTFTDPKDLDMVRKKWASDLLGPQQSLFRLMMEASEMPTANKLEDDIRKWPVDQATKDRLLARAKAFRAQREYNAEGK